MTLPNTFAISNPHHHRGAAMLITMLVTTALVAVLFMASEHTRASSIMTNMSENRLRASMAAESVAALIEAKLVGRAAEVENLTTNLHDAPASWWSLAGCSYTVGGTTMMPTRGLWINGCVVRWRIEPVKIASLIAADTIADDATFSVNRAHDLAQVGQREADANSASTGGTLLAGNPPFFHYRIVTEAYALSDPGNVEAVPWSEAGHHTVSVQVQRVVQLNLVSLFDYAVFYGAIGETGDLEFEPENNTVLNASMHSNGALYLGGAGTTFKSKNYKKAASDGGSITMGGKSEKVQLSGVMGIFRMRKSANVFFASASGNDEVAVRAPLDVPRPGKPVKKAKHGSVMSGLLDLNGGDGNPASEKVSLNGQKFTYNRDSRSDWSLPENRVDPYIKDAKNGGVAITTLANVRDFAGYPLEAQRLVGEQIPLYRTIDHDRFTVNPGRTPARMLYYTASGDITTDRTAAVRPVYATDMPLFRFTDGGGKTYDDVWPNQPITPLSTALSPTNAAPGLNAPIGVGPAERHHTWLPTIPTPGAPGARLGYYLEKSLFGDGSGADTGLTIRERGRQNTAFRWARGGETILTASGVPTEQPPLRSAFATPAEFIRAHVAWLKSNYVVYLGIDFGTPRDITDEFFDFGVYAAQTSGDLTHLVASQDRFVNRREAHWLQDKGYFDAAAEMGPEGEDSARTLRAQPLTLHLAKVCAFLRTNSASYGGNPPAAIFNGLIYLHRTPRLGQVVSSTVGANEVLAPLRYHPVSDPTPRAPDMITNTIHDFLVLGSVLPDAVPAIGSPGSWAIYPLHLPVRIDQAEAIDLGALRPAGVNPGLTIVTPDACYVKGSFNTTAASNGKLPPCALFADSLTVLSNLWSDSQNDQDAAYDGPLPVASDTDLNLSLVLNNLPTDETNVNDGGSGGLHNLVRYLENWNGRTMRLRGSVVVLNRMRYSRSTLGNGTHYRAPNRQFIPDLGVFSEGGKPPFAPSGITVTRMVSTLADGPQ